MKGSGANKPWWRLRVSLWLCCVGSYRDPDEQRHKFCPLPLSPIVSKCGDFGAVG